MVTMEAHRFFLFLLLLLQFSDIRTYIKMYYNTWDSFRQNGPSFIIIKCYKIALHLNHNNFRTVKAFILPIFINSFYTIAL